MRTPKIYSLNFCIILVALTVASGLAWSAETLTATPNSVTFVRTPTVQELSKQVAISGTTDVTAVACDGPTFAGQNLFLGQKSSSNTVTLSVNTALFGFLTQSSYGPNTCTVSGTGGGTVPITVSFSLSNTATNTLTLSTTALSFNAATVGGTPFPSSSQITLSSSVPVGFTISGYPSWLNVTPTAGTTPATITVYPSALGAAGTYTGSITITPTGGAAQTVGVTYGVGVASGSLYVNPNSFNFTWSTGQATPAAQPLYVQSSNASAVAAYVSSYPNWLKVDGSTTAYKTLYGGTTTVNVTVDQTDTSLLQGTNTGNIMVSDGFTSQTLTVYFNVNGGGTGTMYATPTTMSFSYTPGSTYYPPQQSLLINGVGSNFTATAYGGTWLSIMQSGSSVLVNVNPAGLTPATYTGNIYVQSTQLNPVQYLSVPVTFVVGGGIGTGTVAGPSSLTFTTQQGGTAAAYQTIAVAGTYGGTFSASAATSTGGSWLAINATSGNTPGLIGVQVNPGAGLAAGSYYGSVTVTSTYGTITIPVTLTVVATPVVTFSQGNVAVNYQAGAANPGVQQIALGTSGTTPISYTAGSATSWLQVTPQAGTTPQTINLIITTTGLAAGVNTGTVTISAPTAGNPTTTIPVVVNVYGTTSLAVSPTSLTFNTTQGSSPASQTFSITTDVQTTYTASASSGGWLTLSSNSGTTPATVTVNVASAGLSAGQHTASIVIYANGQTHTIPVTLNVGAVVVGTLSANPKTIAFDYMQGDPAPGAQQIQVTSSGAALTFTATAATGTGSGWLSLSSSGGSTPAGVNVSVNPSALGPGTYNGTVTIASAGANGSPQTVNVTLTVRAAPNLVVGTNLAQFTYRTGSGVPGGQAVRVTSSSSELGFTAAGSAGWITVSPAGGTTPADVTIGVNPVGLTANRYTGTVTITATGGGSTQTIEVVLVVTAPLPTITRVVNAASGAEGPIAPGEVLTITGEDMGPANKTDFIVDDTDHYAKTLANVKVRVNGILAPLVYVGANEARAIAPYRLADANEANVQVEYQGSRSNSITTDAVDAAPAIFTADGSGTGPAAAVNQDGSANSASNAAERGTTITVIITGDGQSDPDGDDGKINRGDQNTSPKPVLPVTATIDGLPASVSYAGGVAGQVAGMTQVKISVPLTAGTGYVPLAIKVGKANTQSGVTIALK